MREALSALEILRITESRGGKDNFIKDNFNFPLYEQKFRELEEEVTTIQGSLNKMKDATMNIPEIMEFDREFHKS